MLREIYIIAKYTFKEAVRDRFLLALIGLAILGIPFGMFMKSITIFNGDTSFAATGIAVHNITAVGVSVLYVAVAVRRELESGAIYTVLTNTSYPEVYILGKFFGYLSVLALYLLATSPVVMFLAGENIRYVPGYILATLLQHSIVVGFSFFCSLMLKSSTTALVFSLFAYWLFYATRAIYEMAAIYADGIMRIMASAMYYVMPSLIYFKADTPVIYGTGDDKNYLFLIAYSLIYTMLLLAATRLDFMKREF